MKLKKQVKNEKEVEKNFQSRQKTGLTGKKSGFNYFFSTIFKILKKFPFGSVKGPLNVPVLNRQPTKWIRKLHSP